MDKIIILQEQYQLLLKYLNKYGDSSLNPQISNIKLILEILNKDKNGTNLDNIREINDSLYPPRGGLSEFFIWDNDYEKRVLLNEPVDRAKEITWDILNNENS
ncbi:Uncharacterised protein [Listeria grayi]|uniref:Uncharacterized protein n=1 Tax=Listeria grayi FSL F6-1183 TaxID=1265827 RepID=A0A829R610_LISGR|nr:hypothetical protein [Listeria grayi]EUJ26618.1 hypothetical protein LMUR_12436 [Listeria grayi FSL F6-1183]VEI35908.1 Uncharacterised protein [Listeria grayi]